MMSDLHSHGDVWLSFSSKVLIIKNLVNVTYFKRPGYEFIKWNV